MTISGESSDKPSVVIVSFNEPDADGNLSCTVVETIPQEMIDGLEFPGVYTRAKSGFLRSKSWPNVEDLQKAAEERRKKVEEEQKIIELAKLVSTEVVAKEGDVIVIGCMIPQSSVLRDKHMLLGLDSYGPQIVLFEDKEFLGFSYCKITSSNIKDFLPYTGHCIVSIIGIKSSRTNVFISGVEINCEILAVIPKEIFDKLFGDGTTYQKALRASEDRYEFDTIDSKIKGPNEGIKLGDTIIAEVLSDGRCVEVSGNVQRQIHDSFSPVRDLDPELSLHISSSGKTPGFYVVKTFGGLKSVDDDRGSSRYQACVGIIKPASEELMKKTGYSNLKTLP